MNSKNNKSPWPYQKTFQNQFGIKSQFEDHIDFGHKPQYSSVPSKSQNNELQDQQEVLSFMKPDDSKIENVDMIMTSQKLEDRLSQLNRIRTSINCNEFVRLPLLIAALTFGILASIAQKVVLPDVIAVESQIQTLLGELSDDEDPSLITDVALFTQETKSKIAYVQKLKLSSFLSSILFCFCTVNYYRLTVFKLTKLRDGVHQTPIHWVPILLKCLLSLFHSQCSYTYSSTFTIPGSIQETENTLTIQHENKNQQTFYNDFVVTSLMVIIRMSYFMPKIVLRLYCLLKEEDCEVTKSKNRYILTEWNGISKQQRYSLHDFIQRKECSDAKKYSLSNLFLKNIVVNHPLPVIMLVLANVWGFSVIMYLFMGYSSNELEEFHGVKMGQKDTFYEALFITSNLLFRQQFRAKSKTFFTGPQNAEKKSEGFDLVEYCANSGGQDGNSNSRDQEDICFGVNGIVNSDGDLVDMSGNLIVNPEDILEQETYKLQWYTHDGNDKVMIVQNNTQEYTISYQTTKLYWENNMQLVVMSIFSIGSTILTTFFINLVISSSNSAGPIPPSQQRLQHVMIDILQDQRGLIRTYSATLIQSYHRIKKYQRLCEFPDHHGKVRPGIMNRQNYQTNRSLLKRNIALFKRNQFLIRQYNLFKSGVDKAAPEYHWGFQSLSKSVPRRAHTLLTESCQSVESGILDKLRYETLLKLNQDINHQSLETTLKQQRKTMDLLKQKLESMRQTNIFLNKLQNQYLVVEKESSSCQGQLKQKIGRSSQETNVRMRSIDQIDQFPEILSETSVKKLSDRDYGIKQEKFMKEKTQKTERKRNENRHAISKHEQSSAVANETVTEKDVKNSSEGYSKLKRKRDKVDVPNLKKKLMAMRDRIQRDLDGISEEGYNTDDISGRQVNILISGRHGRVGFEQGTKYKRSKTKGKGSNRSSRRGSSTSKSPSKSPSLKRSNTVSQNTSPGRKSTFKRSQNTRGNKEPPIIVEEVQDVLEIDNVKATKRADNSRSKERSAAVVKIKKIKTKKGGALAGGGIFMANDNSLI